MHIFVDHFFTANNSVINIYLFLVVYWSLIVCHESFFGIYNGKFLDEVLGLDEANTYREGLYFEGRVNVDILNESIYTEILFEKTTSDYITNNQ